PTSQKPVFTSAVDVVSVDVTVVEKYGKPVEDLGRNDFILTVDGQPRKIASAQFVAMHRDVLPSAGIALPASSLPDFSQNTVQRRQLCARAGSVGCGRGWVRVWCCVGATARRPSRGWWWRRGAVSSIASTPPTAW